jgi:alkaline phosphatase D
MFLLSLLLVSLPLQQAAPQSSPPPRIQQQDSERIWVGPQFWANRLQDWRLHDGRFECVEAAAKYPLRTLMLLDQEVVAGSGSLQLEMTTGAIDDVTGDQEPRGFRGFLIGAGGFHVDYRISAQVHHRPAADGGLLATVDTQGQVAFYDNSKRMGAGGSWSIGGALKKGELQQIIPDSFTMNTGLIPPNLDCALVLDIRAENDSYTLKLSAFDAKHSQREHAISSAVLRNQTAAAIDGMIGLVSHLGPKPGSAGHWFENLRSQGELMESRPQQSYGPVLGVQYTTNHHVLKLTAQLPPMSMADGAKAELQIRPSGSREEWRSVASAALQRDSWTLPFRVEEWNAQVATDYRVSYQWQDFQGKSQTTSYRGVIAAEPKPQQEMVVASLNCAKHYVGNLSWNHDSIWFPHAEVAERVALHEPHLLYFAGDQLYEGDIDPVDARSVDKLTLDYLYKWYRWQWSFGELTRILPTVTIPDDHDVYQGNLWGAGGRKAVADKERGLTAQDAGGYRYDASFINVVHATQTSHLPDPFDSSPSEQDISVYFTELDYGGISFAIVGDRQFKDSASDVVPKGDVKNGWFQAPGFDPVDADVEGARLLGDRQEQFLSHWARDWDNQAWMKVLLSQTPFVNVATIPEKAEGGGVLPSLPIPEQGSYPDGYKFAADTDSGGWPQTPRNRVVRTLSSCFAVHLTGDQHLGSLVEYGADEYRDGGFVFTSPAIANTWPRRWWPPFHGGNPEQDAPHYTGDFRDGFGNAMTVWAVSNPVQTGLKPSALYDRTPGYGIIRFRPATEQIVFECWPRWEDPLDPKAQQYSGWPRTISRLDNGPATIHSWLDLPATGIKNGVASVFLLQAGGQELCYSLPCDGAGAKLPVYQPGDYAIRVDGEQGQLKWFWFTDR